MMACLYAGQIEVFVFNNKKMGFFRRIAVAAAPKTKVPLPPVARGLIIHDVVFFAYPV